MTSQTLIEARKAEEIFEKQIDSGDRPAFHLSTRAGWMNDPNGFSFYKGEYHLFYQYYPYAPKWGPMHWGHAVSSDLLRWKYLPAALAPDKSYDKDGCFSGSAVVLPDGRHLLMYTGVSMEGDGWDKAAQTQCLAVGDGLEYEKYEGNPVLTDKDLPQGAFKQDFRDPRMIEMADGTYLCVVGSRPADGSGQILLYESRDGFHWNFKSVLCENRGRFGMMWECPDMFELDGKWMLLTSPQDMLPEGFEYHNGNGTLCLMGSFDQQSGKFTEETDQAIDYGIDFYATQTILAEDGRRIMIGWMQNWDTCDLHMEKRVWCGQMSLPRELSIRNGRLYQAPIRELAEHRRNGAFFEGAVEGIVKPEGFNGRLSEIDIEIDASDEDFSYQKFSVRFAQDERFHTQVSYRPQEGTLKIDRKFSGSRRAVIHQRRTKVKPVDGKLKLKIIQDRFSVEVFVNDGEKVMTAVLYTDTTADGVTFVSEGKTKVRAVKWDLVF
ncbi:MAG: glycoside hydrolase family 32 protein [Blautia sp.]|nr:glycoside hydrolase family 32 protein [Blautia sp.]